MKSWRTTLMGIIAGITMLTGNALQQRVDNPKAPPITLENILPSAAIIVLGILAKDHTADPPPPTPPSPPAA